MTAVFGLVGARPARLVRCRTVLAEVAEGMLTRAAGVDDAVAGYVGVTELEFQADVGAVVGAVEAVAAVVRDLGAWVGAVGESFLDADAARALTAGGMVPWFLDGVTLSSPEAFDDRFAEVAPPVLPGGSLTGGATSAGPEDDGDGFLISLGVDDGVGALGALADASRTGAGTGTGVAAALSSERFGRIATGVSRVAAVAGVAFSAHGRWQADRDLDLTAVERVGRAATQAGIEAGGFGADRLLDRDPPPPDPEEVGDAVAAIDERVVDDIVDEVAAVAEDAGAMPDWREAGRVAWADPSRYAPGFDEAAELARLAVVDDPWPGDPPTWYGPKPDVAREIATGRPG